MGDWGGLEFQSQIFGTDFWAKGIPGLNGHRRYFSITLTGIMLAPKLIIMGHCMEQRRAVESHFITIKGQGSAGGQKHY